MTQAGVKLDRARNRAALVLLPREVSKGSGIRQALLASTSWKDSPSCSFHQLASQVRKAERGVDTDGATRLARLIES